MLKTDKGKKDESCNVTACQEPGATWFNNSTLAYYCPSCARKINRACIDFREPRLCIPPAEQKARDEMKEINNELHALPWTTL